MFYLKFLICFKKNEKLEEKNYVDGMQKQSKWLVCENVK